MVSPNKNPVFSQNLSAESFLKILSACFGFCGGILGAQDSYDQIGQSKNHGSASLQAWLQTNWYRCACSRTADNDFGLQLKNFSQKGPLRQLRGSLQGGCCRPMFFACVVPEYEPLEILRISFKSYSKGVLPSICMFCVSGSFSASCST